MKHKKKWIALILIGLVLRSTAFSHNALSLAENLSLTSMEIIRFIPTVSKQFCFLTPVDGIVSNISEPCRPQANFQQKHILPPLETFVIKPVKLDHFSIQVPADKTVPISNWMCFAVNNYKYTCTLPAKVEHTKSKDCPKSIGRLLAEYSSPYHQDSLPLTILNGWKWEYLYNLSQFETEQYEVPSHGSWENCLEAILSQSNGSICGRWLQITQDRQLVETTPAAKQESNIEITTFSSIRRRHGYPKVRMLD